MAAKHILIAQGKAQHSDGRSGPRAGFDAYMEGKSPLALATQTEIRSAGNKKAQFNHYCAKFGDKFGNGTVNTPAVAARDEDEKASLVEKLLALITGNTEPVGVQVVEEEPEEDDPILAAAKLILANAGVTGAPAPKTRKAATPQVAAPAADKFAPSEKNAPLNCTNGRLWKLNQAGMLMLRQPAGPPLTNAQAHAVLRSIES